MPAVFGTYTNFSTYLWIYLLRLSTWQFVSNEYEWAPLCHFSKLVHTFKQEKKEKEKTQTLRAFVWGCMPLWGTAARRITSLLLLCPQG